MRDCRVREDLLTPLQMTTTINYINKKTVEQISMYYYGEDVNTRFTRFTDLKVNVVTCDYKSQCRHM